MCLSQGCLVYFWTIYAFAYRQFLRYRSQSNGHKSLYQLRIKLTARTALELLQCFLVRKRTTIGTRRCHSIEGIGYGKNARFQWNSFTF